MVLRENVDYHDNLDEQYYIEEGIAPGDAAALVFQLLYSKLEVFQAIDILQLIVNQGGHKRHWVLCIEELAVNSTFLPSWQHIVFLETLLKLTEAVIVLSPVLCTNLVVSTCGNSLLSHECSARLKQILRFFFVDPFTDLGLLIRQLASLLL